MQKAYLSYLLELYEKNGLSEKQLEELDNWFQSLSSGQDLDSWIEEAGGKDELIAKFYKNFETNYISINRKPNIFSLKNLSIAATIIIVSSVGLFFAIKPKKKETARIAVVEKTITPIIPGGNKAILTLSNGRQINLNDHKTGDLVSQASLRIRKTKDGQLVYETVDKGAANIGFNTVSTPNGGQYQVILADGTHVWLNAASSLRYPNKFVGDKREVELTGEAYFEVAHNPKKPFLVTSRKQTITVLGTHFNINTYNDEPFVKTTLLQGSVRINEIGSDKTRVLKPGQQAVLTNNSLSVNAVDTRTAVAWKNGFFRFQDEDIRVIMNQISRWYNVDVNYQGDFDNMRFGGYVSRDKSIEQILNLMEVTKTVHFKIEGRRIIVMK